jgi:hypothetical protein
MVGMLVRKVTLVFLACVAFLSALEQLDRPEQMVLVDSTAVKLKGDDLAALFNAAVKPDRPQVALPSPYMIDTSAIVQVLCNDGSSGTAFYLGMGRFMTAAHVVLGKSNLRCWLRGHPATIRALDAKADWAILTAAHYPPYRVVFSCNRMVEGETYFATGYAEGMPWPVTTRLRASAEHLGTDGTDQVRGSLVDGMSGGTVADRDGVVYAINDWRSEDGIPGAGVVELAATPLCKKA